MDSCVPGSRAGGHVLVTYTDDDTNNTQYALDPSIQALGTGFSTTEGDSNVAPTFANYRGEGDSTYTEWLTANSNETFPLTSSYTWDNFTQFRSDSGLNDDINNVLRSVGLTLPSPPNDLDNDVDLNSMATTLFTTFTGLKLVDLVMEGIFYPVHLATLGTVSVESLVRGFESTMQWDEYTIPFPFSDFVEHRLVNPMMEDVDNIDVGEPQNARATRTYNLNARSVEAVVNSPGNALGGGSFQAGSARTPSSDSYILKAQSMLVGLANQEKDLLAELYNLGSINQFNCVDGEDRYIADWPKIHETLEKIEAIHYRMKLVYAAVKMKLDFMNKLSASIGDVPKRDVSAAADSVFNQHFEFTNNVIGLMKQIISLTQSNNLQNSSVKSGRWVSRVQAVITTIFEIISTALNILSVIPIFYGLKPFTVIWDVVSGLLEAMIIYYADPYNPKNLKFYRDFDDDSERQWRMDDGSLDSNDDVNDYLSDHPGSLDSLRNVVDARLSVGSSIPDIFVEGHDYTNYFRTARGFVETTATSSTSIVDRLPDFSRHDLFTTSPLPGTIPAAEDAAGSVHAWNVRMNEGDIIGVVEAPSFDVSRITDSTGNPLSAAQQTALRTHLSSNGLPLVPTNISLDETTFQLTYTHLFQAYGLRDSVISDTAEKTKILQVLATGRDVSSRDFIQTAGTAINAERSAQIWRALFEIRTLPNSVDQEITRLLTHLAITDSNAEHVLQAIATASTFQPSSLSGITTDTDKQQALYDGLLEIAALDTAQLVPLTTTLNNRTDSPARATTAIERQYMNDIRRYYDRSVISGPVDLSVNASNYFNNTPGLLDSYAHYFGGVTPSYDLIRGAAFAGGIIGTGAFTGVDDAARAANAASLSMSFNDLIANDDASSPLRFRDEIMSRIVEHFSANSASTRTSFSYTYTVTQNGQDSPVTVTTTLTAEELAMAQLAGLSAQQKMSIQNDLIDGNSLLGKTFNVTDSEGNTHILQLSQQHVDYINGQSVTPHNNEAALEAEINRYRLTHAQRTSAIKEWATSSTISIDSLRDNFAPSTPTSSQQRLAYDQAERVFTRLTGGVSYMVNSEPISSIGGNDPDNVIHNYNQRSALLLYQDQSRFTEISRRVNYTDRQALLTRAYQVDLNTTGARTWVVFHGNDPNNMVSRDRYLRTNYFDYAQKFLEEKMFAEIILEMVNSSKFSVWSSLAQKIAGGGLKQSSNIATDYVQDASMQLMSHYSTQISDIQNWHDLKVSLNTQRYQADKAYDTQVIMAIIFGALSIGLAAFKKFRKASSQMQQALLQIVKSSTEFIIAVMDASQKNEVEEDDEDNTNAETLTEEDGAEDAHTRQQNDDAGSEALGFNFKTVDYREKARAAIRISRKTNALKSLINASKSEAELYMMLVEMLGGITSKMTVSKGMLNMIASAKSTSMKILDNRYKMKEANVKRHNEKQSAHMKALVSAVMVIFDAAGAGASTEAAGRMMNKIKNSGIAKSLTKSVSKKLSGRFGQALKTFGRGFLKLLSNNNMRQYFKMMLEGIQVDQLNSMNDRYASEGDGMSADEETDAGDDVSIDALMIGAEINEGAAKSLININKQIGERGQQFAGAIKALLKNFSSFMKFIANQSSSVKSESQGILDKTTDKIRDIGREMDKLETKEQKEQYKTEQVKQLEQDLVANIKVLLGNPNPDIVKNSGKNITTSFTDSRDSGFNLVKAVRPGDHKSNLGSSVSKLVEQIRKKVRNKLGDDTNDDFEAHSKAFDQAVAGPDSALDLESGMEATASLKGMMKEAQSILGKDDILFRGGNVTFQMGSKNWSLAATLALNIGTLGMAQNVPNMLRKSGRMAAEFTDVEAATVNLMAAVGQVAKFKAGKNRDSFLDSFSQKLKKTFDEGTVERAMVNADDYDPNSWFRNVFTVDVQKDVEKDLKNQNEFVRKLAMKRLATSFSSQGNADRAQSIIAVFDKVASGSSSIDRGAEKLEMIGLFFEANRRKENDPLAKTYINMIRQLDGDELSSPENAKRAREMGNAFLAQKRHYSYNPFFGEKSRDRVQTNI